MIESPHNEAAVLGSMMFGRGTWPTVKAIIGPDDFYRPEHKVIWEGLMAIDSNAEPDLVLLRNEIIKMGKLDSIGGVDYLVAVMESVPSPASAEYYAREVYEYSQQRKVEAIGLRIKEFKSEPSDDQITEIKSMLAQIKPKQTQPTHFEACEQAVAELEGAMTAIPTGFGEIDKIIVGLEPGLTVVGGSTSMGKTVLALSVVMNWCRIGKRVLFVTREMTRSQLLHRLYAMTAPVPLMAMRERTADLKMILKGAGEVAEWDLFIDGEAGTWQQVEAAMDRMGDVDLIVVDYAQLMNIEGERTSMHLKMLEVVLGLKILGTQRGVPVMLVSQLNKGVSDRKDDRHPRLNDLKESGSFGEFANLVLLIYREDYYIERFGAEGNITGTVEVCIAKQQQGDTGCAVLKFNKQYVRCENIRTGE